MRKDNKAEGFKVKYCLSCKTPFETYWKPGHTSTKLSYYGSLTPYGLKKETCPICNGEGYKFKNKNIRGLYERTSIKKIY